MPTPGVHLEVVFPPQNYSDEQLSDAALVAHCLHRGKFVLCETPERIAPDEPRP